MALKCPNCGYTNPDSTVFCEECGEPVDPKTRLLMELEGKVTPPNVTLLNKIMAADPNNPRTHSDNSEDSQKHEEYNHAPLPPQSEKKLSPIGCLCLLACAATVCALLLLGILFLINSHPGA